MPRCAPARSLYENSEVLRYEDGGEVRVHTAQGTVRCAYLVLCGNAYIGAVAPSLARRILGVGTYIIATEPLGEERARSLLPSNAAVADLNWILDYFSCSRDHRLLFGGRVSYSSVQPPRLAESMRRRMVRVFPSLSDVKVANAWGGYLDITMSRAPDFGRLATNVYYLQGFSGHGVALAGLAGALASEAIAGTAERFDVFARIPHRDFPGGRAAAPALAHAGDALLPVARLCCSAPERYLSSGFSEAAKLADEFLAGIHQRDGYSSRRRASRRAAD